MKFSIREGILLFLLRLSVKTELKVLRLCLREPRQAVLRQPSFETAENGFSEKESEMLPKT